MKKKTLFGLLLSSTLILAGVGSYIGINAYNQYVEELNDEDIETEIIKGHGMTLKKLSTTNNSDGSVTKTFSYTILPSDATNKSVIIGFYTSNSYSNSNYITYSVNSSTQKISVTCKKAFGEQIKLRVQSTDNSSVYSYITLDYQRKVKSITQGQFGSMTLEFSGDSDLIDGDVDLDNGYVKYQFGTLNLDSIYTINTIVSFYMKAENILVKEDAFSNYTFPLKGGNDPEMYGELVLDALNNCSSVKDEDIWNILETNYGDDYTAEEHAEFKQALLDCNEDDRYILFSVDITCYTSPASVEYTENFDVLLYFNRQYTGLTI